MTRESGSSSSGRIKYFHFPGVKQQERESDHSSPTSAEVKKMWIYTSTPLYVFMA
jgi:hypothetical protein